MWLSIKLSTGATLKLEDSVYVLVASMLQLPTSNVSSAHLNFNIAMSVLWESARHATLDSMAHNVAKKKIALNVHLMDPVVQHVTIALVIS